jgi:ribosomal protein S18 acetylase RimI-like enzyme
LLGNQDLEFIARGGAMGTGKGEAKIRRMTEADLQRVKDIDKELAGPYRYISWPVRVEAHWWLHRGMSSFVAEMEGEVVGFVLGDIRGTEYTADMCAWIDMMGVSPKHQSRGIGRMLVQAFCQECQSRKVKVRVVLVEDDKRLVDFWKSIGFKKGNLVSYEK